MKKNHTKLILIVFFSLSIFSTLYLNKMEQSDSQKMIELTEIENNKDRMITHIKFVGLVVDRVLDIVTTRRS